MRKTGRILAAATALAFAFAAQAAPEKTVSFDVDMDIGQKLPPYEEMLKKYVADNRIVDRGYDFHWDIGNIFDSVFRMTIDYYGQTEKRIKNVHEDDLTALLSSVPPEYYQYIGPYLHTVPNMPEKILNMPGIKETKNRFPKRIARELEGIEDLEFVSPYLYYVLMPESWPDYRRTMEKAPRPSTRAKVEHDPAFFEKVKALVPDEDFLPGAEKQSKLSLSDLRTLEPTKNGPLTAADVKAFTGTLDKVNAFTKDLKNYDRINTAGILIDVWEKENGRGPQVSLLKDLVNPCQRLVQKVRYAGLEREFSRIVNTEGFDAEGWAYTCDKAVKAYRVSMLTRSVVAGILMYRQGVYDAFRDIAGERIGNLQRETVQAVLEMYEAPTVDVLETRKNRSELGRKIIDNNRFIGNAPILVLY